MILETAPHSHYLALGTPRGRGGRGTNRGPAELAQARAAVEDAWAMVDGAMLGGET